MKKTYKIYVDCANCANKITDALSKVDGIESVDVNFMLQKLKVVFKDNADTETIKEIIRKKGKQIDSDFELYWCIFFSDFFCL